MVGTFLATLASGNTPVLGLDLQGGVSVVLSPVGKYKSDSLDVAVDIIRNRVDSLGTLEPEITRQGNDIVDRPARREGPRPRPSRSSARPPSCASGRCCRAPLPSDGQAQAPPRRPRPTAPPRPARRPPRPPTTTPSRPPSAAARPRSRRATTPRVATLTDDPHDHVAPTTSATRASCCPTSPAARRAPLLPRQGRAHRQGRRQLGEGRVLVGPGLDRQDEPHRARAASKWDALAAAAVPQAGGDRARRQGAVGAGDPARPAAFSSFGGTAVISGSFTRARPTTWPSSSTTARCRCTLKQVNVENVSPTLGNDQLHAGHHRRHHRPRAGGASTCSSSTACSAWW